MKNPSAYYLLSAQSISEKYVKHFSYVGIIKCYNCSNKAIYGVMRVLRK